MTWLIVIGADNFSVHADSSAREFAHSVDDRNDCDIGAVSDSGVFGSDDNGAY